MTNNVLTILSSLSDWTAPEVDNATMMHGDMPGDKIEIGDSHKQKAATVFPVLVEKLKAVMENHPHQRAVVCVCGGSGVGKSEIASLLGEYLQKAGVGSYVLSGDNYPHRIPAQNDAERLRVFRCGGVRGPCGGRRIQRRSKGDLAYFARAGYRCFSCLVCGASLAGRLPKRGQKSPERLSRHRP